MGLLNVKDALISYELTISYQQMFLFLKIVALTIGMLFIVRCTLGKCLSTSFSCLSLFTFLFLLPQSLCLPFCLYYCLSACLGSLSVCLSVCLFVHLSFRLPIYQYLPFVFPFSFLRSLSLVTVSF